MSPWPLCVDIDLSGSEAPAWQREWLRGQCGWLFIADLALRSNRNEWAEEAAVATNPDGDPLPEWAGPLIWSLPSTMPRPCDEVPPEADAALDAAGEAFRRRIAREAVTRLRRLEDDTVDAVGALTAAADAAARRADRDIARLRAIIRAPEATPDNRAAAREAITAIEWRTSRVMTETQAAIARVRAAAEEAEAEALRHFNPKLSMELTRVLRWRVLARPTLALGRAAEASDGWWPVVGVRDAAGPQWRWWGEA